MTRIQRIAAAAACALSLAFPASAQLIGSGHVMGNGTSSPRTPTDTPLGQVLNQSGSGIAKAGNTNTLATVSGVIPNGHCWSTDANHNAIDAGGACTVGGGGGTVNAGATPQFAHYGSTGNVVSGMALANPLLGPNVNNVLAYGADPTGTTDATSAFNAAAAAAIAGGTGSSVFVPCGTYLVTPGMDWVIPSPGSFAFIGGGVDCAILKATAPTTTLLEIEYAGSQSELTLGGVTFATGNASTTSMAIFLKSNVTTQAQNFAGSTIDRIGRRGDTGYGQGHYWAIASTTKRSPI
jgi:hypothetical protein